MQWNKKNSYMQLDMCPGLLEEATQDVLLLQKLSFQKQFLQIWSTKFVINNLTEETEALGWIHRNRLLIPTWLEPGYRDGPYPAGGVHRQSERPRGKGPFATQRSWKYCLWLQVSSHTHSMTCIEVRGHFFHSDPLQCSLRSTQVLLHIQPFFTASIWPSFFMLTSRMNDSTNKKLREDSQNLRFRN